MAVRRLPIGAEVAGDRGVDVRVWAPGHAKVTLVVESEPARRGPREILLERMSDGYHGGFVPGLGAGARYRVRLGDGAALLADPASRYQPEGPDGPSEIVDPSTFAWTDAAWTGIAPDRHVLYEMHIGTFTPEGTWDGAAAWLGYLADVGITTLEVMPVADFAGRRNWGYDGVNLFAPSRCYGPPDAMRRFVDRAHSVGLAVILDVVYNHIGPAGNQLPAWSPAYQSDRTGEWGAMFNLDGDDAGPVRALVIANAGYWIDEFHLDGLRLDAVQAIRD